MRRPCPRRSSAALLVCAALLAACSSRPPPPDWLSNARSALDSATAAQLTGDSRAEARDFDHARGQIASTGRADLMARAELMRCAARVAGLQLGPCEGFETLRADAAAPELAYAAYLQGQPLPREQIELLPAAQRPAAAAVGSGGGDAPLGSVTGITDPLARLIAVAVLFQAGKASPAMISAAVDTASAQGWRRPLLAWLEVQAQRAERSGDAAEAQRLRRRIALVLDRP